MLKIGFDAKRLFFNTSGLGSYARNLLNGLSHYHPDNYYHLYVPKSKITVGTAAFTPANNMQLHTPPSARAELLGGALWRTFTMGNQLKEDRIQVYHGLSNELPANIRISRAKSVVTIHDLLFLKYPQYYPIWDRFVYKQKCKHACRVADRIVAVSEQTKNELLEHLHAENTKIIVIYPCCDPLFYAYDDALHLQHGFFVTKEYDLPFDIPNDYVLFLGNVEERKNLMHLVKAIGALRNRLEVHLVVAGKGKATYRKLLDEEIARLGVQKQVTFLDHVPQQYLPALYRCAKAFIYPSSGEGWGMPIVEALFSRIPVIAGDCPAQREAGGSHTQYVSPNDTEAFAHTIEQVLTVGSLRMDMLINGWQHAQQFRQEELCGQMFGVYKGLV